MQILFEIFFCLIEVIDEEWIFFKVFIEGWLGMCVWGFCKYGFGVLLLYNFDDIYLVQIFYGLYFNYGENVGE